MGAFAMNRIAVGALLVASLCTACPEQRRPAASDPALPGIGRPDGRLAAKLADATRAKGPEYRPRTRHLNPDGSPKFTNRLVLETSPYLLQHAHNPVNWYAWGDEAFERARRENKPVLLSIGYSSCHWCHVMEEESFEDVEIASLLNERFVAVKVDREERPDLDTVYMKVLLLLSGRGGWPMTLVLTPAREPFFAATYIPARDGDRGAQTGFLTLLRQLDSAYRKDPERVLAAAREITDRVREASGRSRSGDVPGPEAIRNAAVLLARSYDADHGGFGLAPKFPTPSHLALLARYHRRTGDPHALRMLETTLAKMAAGGIHDQIGGPFLVQGFLDLREATQDPRWLSEAIALHALLEKRFWDERAGGFFQTPHDHEALLAREKPAYDGAEPSGNAVAILNLLRLEELTGVDRYRKMAEQALAAFASDLKDGSGAEMMLSALDFRLDTPLEIVIVSPPDGSAAPLEAVLRRTFVPNRIYATASEGPELEERARLIPLLAGKRALRGVATAYVCRQRTCDLPTSDPTVFSAQLARTEPLFRDASVTPLPTGAASGTR